MKANTQALRAWLPERRADAHKGDFGHVLIVAGSRGMAGAAILAARAACRGGAGLVTLAVPRELQPQVAGQVPEALTLGLAQTPAGSLAPESCGQLFRESGGRRWTVLAIGPGLGTGTDTERAVLGVLGKLRLPAVIDADGLNCLSRHSRPSLAQLFANRGAPCVLTPHPGEMGRLLALETAEVQARRGEAAARLSSELGCVCLLKGRGTVVCDRERRFLNVTGNPGLARGGTGDVLTGLIAALWAQRLTRAGEAREDRGFEAAALGAWLHGAAGDAAARLKTQRALVASDVIDCLPDAFRKLG
ncbi:MAG: NAD(P)H-hydrate dehydratase [Elusimicrobia bacterium]|nr:NAD(P)H-hydrate dehydratase [Elusimicrobiota bacterium]